MRSGNALQMRVAPLALRPQRFQKALLPERNLMCYGLYLMSQGGQALALRSLHCSGIYSQSVCRFVLLNRHLAGNYPQNPSTYFSCSVISVANKKSCPLLMTHSKHSGCFISSSRPVSYFYSCAVKSKRWNKERGGWGWGVNTSSKIQPRPRPRLLLFFLCHCFSGAQWRAVARYFFIQHIEQPPRQAAECFYC